MEQYQDISVYVSNTSLTATSGMLIYNGNTKNNSHLYELHSLSSYLFRYLIIRRSVSSVLTICEIKIVQDSEYISNLYLKAVFDLCDIKLLLRLFYLDIKLTVLLLQIFNIIIRSS
jgi:hypothetical protein